MRGARPKPGAPSRLRPGSGGWRSQGDLHGSTNDGFGGSVAADTFFHTLISAGLPTPKVGLDQDLDTVSGGAEPALAPYRPSGAASATASQGTGDGIPGAGQLLGSSTLYALPHSNVTAYQPGTGGLPAAGDRFGYAARQDPQDPQDPQDLPTTAQGAR